MVCLIGWEDWEPHARPEVALMLPLGHAAEVPYYKVMVCVVPGVTDSYILEQTTARTKDVVQSRYQDFVIDIRITVVVIIQVQEGPPEGPPEGQGRG